jgi:hypothetical protein
VYWAATTRGFQPGLAVRAQNIGLLAQMLAGALFARPPPPPSQTFGGLAAGGCPLLRGNAVGRWPKVPVLGPCYICTRAVPPLAARRRELRRAHHQTKEKRQLFQFNSNSNLPRLLYRRYPRPGRPPPPPLPLPLSFLPCLHTTMNGASCYVGAFRVVVASGASLRRLLPSDLPIISPHYHYLVFSISFLIQLPVLHLALFYGHTPRSCSHKSITFPRTACCSSVQQLPGAHHTYEMLVGDAIIV